MLIRPVQEEDFNEWLPLWVGYQEFYQVAIPEDVTLRTWERFLDPHEPMHCEVAVQGEQLVGMVHYIFHRSCWTKGDYCYLQDLYVPSEMRGHGVARALIERVYAQATAAGSSRVWWLTHESNETAIALYDRIADKSGFIQYRKLLA